MEVLTDDEGSVGILLNKKEAIILRYFIAIGHPEGKDNVEHHTEYTYQDANTLEYDLWEQLRDVLGE